MKQEIPSISAAEITPQAVYLARRQFIGKSLLAGAGAVLAPAASGLFSEGEMTTSAQRSAPDWLTTPVQAALSVNRKQAGHFTDEQLTPYKDATNYNNFYEFGTDKRDPYDKASEFKPHPWTVTIDGLVGKPGTYALEDILRPHSMQERVYRLRCVEAWSMVIPWIGFPLADLLARFEPMSDAKYVLFETLRDPERMPAQKSFFSTIDWPYREGLRLDEALHPLTLMAAGMYGEVLPGQNGAPLRLVVPWKYGFKSIKSIVRISLVARMPKTTWNQLQPKEYGFYANVNPQVDHPRWSQASERRLPGKGLFPKRIKTHMFNGYAEQVALLYKGMDLRRYY